MMQHLKIGAGCPPQHVSMLTFNSRCFGLTKHPTTNEYAMIIEYFEKGDLRQFNKANRKKLTFQEKLQMLNHISQGLNKIHSAGLCHRDLHSGNILVMEKYTNVSDLGLCGPAASPTM